jgi:hypothetical protein
MDEIDALLNNERPARLAPLQLHAIDGRISIFNKKPDGDTDSNFECESRGAEASFADGTKYHIYAVGHDRLFRQRQGGGIPGHLQDQAARHQPPTPTVLSRRITTRIGAVSST